MEGLIILFSEPATWAALATLIVLEIVLGIDNLVFISILSNKLPPAERDRAQRLGLGAALALRLALLGAIAWIVGLTKPAFAAFGHGFSWRDLILITGGLFLVWKATKEIHHNVDPSPNPDVFDTSKTVMTFGAAIVQISLLNIVFSIDSILTAIGMTDDVPVMVIAVVVSVGAMLFAARPLAGFIEKNPTIVMLALGFLLMIGTTLIAEGFGAHIPKGYIYAAMAFSVLVEVLNILARRARQRREMAK